MYRTSALLVIGEESICSHLSLVHVRNLHPGANLHPGCIFGHVNGVLRICTRHMVKTQKSSSDVMAAGMTVGPKQVRMNQSNKSQDLMMQSNMAAPRNPQIR